jgi:Tfp pilus assembly protein PilF
VEQHEGPDHPLLLRPLNNMAVLYDQAGQREEAEATFKRARSICEKYLSPDHPSYAAVLTNYAAFLRHAGEKSRAKDIEEQARALTRQNASRQGLGLTVDVSSFRQK